MIILCGKLLLWWPKMNDDSWYSTHSCAVLSHTDSGLVHGTVFGQRDIRKCDASSSLVSAFILGLVFLEYSLLEPSCHIVKKCIQPCGQP